MKLFRFHRHTTLRHLLPTIAQVFFGATLLCQLSVGLLAQNPPESACFFNTSASISCTGVTIRFTAPPNPGDHFWDFGDGTTSTDPPPAFHDYFDVNPDVSPITATHVLSGTECQKVVDFPGIFLGIGCESQRKVSEMVAANKLPANELVGKNLYLFGSLEVDVPYKFDGCNIYVAGGRRISVTSGAKLTLSGNTVVDAHTKAGECEHLWNGIEVMSSSTLETNGAIIQNAFYAISPIKDDPVAFPVLSIRNTTFRRNFVGIMSETGGFVFSLFQDNTFEGSGNNPIYQLGTCNAPTGISGVPYARRTYCGIYFDGTAGGSLQMNFKTRDNVFKNLQAGIVSINASTIIRGCRFENIAFLSAAPALYQGTAITSIVNIGRKNLEVYGLGKNSTPTIHNCERGVYALTTARPATVHVSDCRMTEVQNGINIDASGTGNFINGRVSDCHIECTKYLPNIKKRSTGIEIKDQNISYSNFIVNNNDIVMDQPEAYTILPGNPPFVLFDQEIFPKGIALYAIHSLLSEMDVQIYGNDIQLVKGHHGISCENIRNANISFNTIVNRLDGNFGDLVICGCCIQGGSDNTLICNNISQISDQMSSSIAGFFVVSSRGTILSRNITTDLGVGISFVDDNGTSCAVAYNDFQVVSPSIIGNYGLFYANSITGPQYLNGNDWIGDFVLGAQYLQGNGAYTYCDSRYHVSPEANVANVTNPVDQGQLINCIEPPNIWFTVLEEQEDDLNCSGTGGGPVTLYKNEADLNLADGGTLGLSPGYKWSSEMGLYRKFTDNPDLASGDPVISGFLQSQQELPVDAMYNVQNGVRDIEGNIPAALAGNIQNTLAQLETNEAALLALLEDIETDSNALADYTVLSAQTHDLELLLEGYLADAIGVMAQNASTVLSANNSINCSTLPCSSERYINGLYLETQLIAPRALTVSELESIAVIGTYCPKDAGNIVYMARAWYYMQTGEMLSTDCGSFVPEAMEERYARTQTVSDGHFLLMPNPADGGVQVVLPANKGGGMLLLTDLWGQMLFQRTIPEETENVHFSTEGLPNGIYMIVFKGQSGKPMAQKLVIQH